MRHRLCDTNFRRGCRGINALRKKRNSTNFRCWFCRRYVCWINTNFCAGGCGCHMLDIRAWCGGRGLQTLIKKEAITNIRCGGHRPYICWVDTNCWCGRRHIFRFEQDSTNFRCGGCWCYVCWVGTNYWDGGCGHHMLDNNVWCVESVDSELDKGTG